MTTVILMLTSTLAMSTTHTFMTSTTIMSNITTPLKIMTKGGTIITMKKNQTQHHMNLLKVLPLLKKITTQVKGCCAKKTQKIRSSATTSSNDMRARQSKSI